MLPGYAELHCRSNYSFLTGASYPWELVERAAALGYSALAITDECSLAGVVRAHVAAQEHGLHLIIGSEMQLVRPGSPPPSLLLADDEGDTLSGAPAALSPAAAPPDLRAAAGAGAASASPTGRVSTGAAGPGAVVPCLVLLAQSRRGYGNLSHWITLARRRAPKGSYLAHPHDLEGKEPNAANLAGLPGCLALLVPNENQPFEEVFAQAMWLKTWFGDRAGIALSRLGRAGDEELAAVVLQVARFTGLPIVATGDVLMHIRSRKPLQDTLTATRLRKPVAECGWQLAANAEQHLRPRGRLATLYEAEWLANSLAFAGRCSFSLASLKYEYPREIVPEGQTPTSHLRHLTLLGFARRFPGETGAPWRERIEKELALIKQLEYEAYFLTVADIVRWAREHDIICQGRGSAANSVVCYCLEVTAVNPAEASLLFERFISEERKEPPDIDVDFEHQRREEVIQYIYGKYGRSRAALTAVVNSYRPRSALRDVGRALGMDLQRIEMVTKSLHWFDGRNIDDQRLRDSGLDPDSPVTRLWMELTQQLIGFPRHLSQHPGGFVISRGRIEELVPVENASMADRSVVQWDKDDLDALGLIKVDILALGILSAIRRSLDFIGEKCGRPLPMHQVPRGDATTYDMICRADTVGVFQIESRAQMSMLPRLKPRVYYDLVVQVAIVRPGPIQGGMVHPYLRNRELPADEIVYPSDEIRLALERTLGVPIFQEQVMQIAIHAADFTPGEADRLRRAMAAWKRRGGLTPFHDKLVGRMVEKGYDPAFAEAIFKQIQGFGEYGFPESHAAGFAQLAYVSSWIKRHHPDAFLAGLLNSQPMGFYAPAQLVRDAREHGVEVLPVDVHLSGVQSSLEPPDDQATAVGADSADKVDGRPQPAAGAAMPSAFWAGGRLRPVRLGLDRVSGLSAAAANRIVAARSGGSGGFANLEDLARRASLCALDLQALAQADALKTIAGHRHQAAWEVAGVDTRPTPMLRQTRVQEAPAVLDDLAEADEVLADYRSLGLTLHRHPLALLRQELNRFRVEPAAVLRGYPDGRLARASGLVTHRQRPETAKGTMFVTLEDDTGAVNVIVWPAVVDAQRKPLLAARLLTVFGRWQRQGEGDQAVMHLVAMKVLDHSDLLQGLSVRSRDFR